MLGHGATAVPSSDRFCPHGLLQGSESEQIGLPEILQCGKGPVGLGGGVGVLRSSGDELLSLAETQVGCAGLFCAKALG